MSGRLVTTGVKKLNSKGGIVAFNDLGKTGIFFDVGIVFDAQHGFSATDQIDTSASYHY
jgi:hypothetical protein